MARYRRRWRRYVPVAARRERAARQMARRRRKGADVQPVVIEGRKIARTFWGQAWCDHLEQFGDFENRLPRGRTYVRNGSVCHLGVARGRVEAVVSGSMLYDVRVEIKDLPAKRWAALKKRCVGGIGSLLELLEGRLSESVMEVVTDPLEGLFPLAGEISYSCNCPDWAVMCKHVAAVLYGVGARLDESPELLFVLRGVDHQELIESEEGVVGATGKKRKGARRLASTELSSVFGIEITSEEKKMARKTSRKTPKASTKPKRVTSARVLALRRRFGMNRVQFARVVGVSPPAVRSWELAGGALKLQTRTLAAWNAASKLTPDEAWDLLEDS